MCFYQLFLSLNDFYIVFGMGPLLKLKGSPNGLFSEKGSPLENPEGSPQKVHTLSKPKNEDDLTIMENSIQKRKGDVHGRYGSVIIKSLKARIQTMSFPTYINFQVNNTEGGRSNMVVHSHAVILMLLSLFPESFGIFYILFLFVTRTRTRRTRRILTKKITRTGLITVYNF